MANRKFRRTNELKALYEEVLEQLYDKNEWFYYNWLGKSVYVDFYHMTNRGSTYYVQVEIQEGICNECEVWRITDKPKTKDDYILGNVSRMLGDWLDGWGIARYCRMNEEDERIGCTRDSTGLDSAFGSWGEVNSMFI